MLAGGASARSAAGNAPVNFEPDGRALRPAPSETLTTLTRHYILDPGTRIETVNIGPNICGRRKMLVALEVADEI